HHLLFPLFQLGFDLVVHLPHQILQVFFHLPAQFHPVAIAYGVSHSSAGWRAIASFRLGSALSGAAIVVARGRRLGYINFWRRGDSRALHGNWSACRWRGI